MHEDIIYCIYKNFKDKINKQLAFNEFLQLFSNKTTHNDNILHEYLSGEH